MEVDFVNELSPKAARAQPLDLAVPHLPSSDLEAVKLLNTSIRPALEVVNSANLGLIRLLLDYVLRFIFFQLKCCLRVTFQQNNASEQRRSDIILAVKESNKTTRNMAYDLLVQIGHACWDEDQGGNKENLQQLFNMSGSCVIYLILNDLIQMISAAVKGMARLAYEFSDLVLSACNVMNREIIKVGSLSVDAGYYFCQSPAEWLQTHLGSVAEGLSRWQNDSKKLFKAKVGIQVNLFLFVICFVG
ncbi:hypothetical protein MKX03_000868 [Papaver bracteatum]|nr:hypothetical protein MKX03_011792 [Papaver bracteatum]KAI3897527.1 hypothetical protein MKX03_000868 [Papaver bracteatum]